MKRLLKIAQSATPSAGVQFRGSAYGAAGTREFLRDVLAIANAAVDGARYIIVGATFDEHGRKQIREVDPDDFSSKLGDIPPGEFVDVFEVPLRLCVGAGLQGKRFGMQYSLFAQNLRAPAKGKLRLLF